jgi:diadenosine tetraphosphate (Ap4A) HIT family hydrolase
MKLRIDHSFSPTGYNIGINIGATAGQSIQHVHIHLIPRFTGDVPDPFGGVRNVIPDKGRYPLADE